VGKPFRDDPPKLIVVPYLFEVSDLVADHLIDQFFRHVSFIKVFIELRTSVDMFVSVDRLGLGGNETSRTRY
jgi:hypothetical protein